MAVRTLETVTTCGARRVRRAGSRLLESATDSTEVLGTYVAVANSVCPWRYTDADPFKLLTVDPDAIEYMTTDITAPMGYGRVVAGDWDRKREPIEENTVYRSFRQRFHDGDPWEETPLYERHESKVETGTPVKGYRSMAELRSWYREMDRLYHTVVENGFRSQRELLEIEPEETRRRCNDAATPERNEIGVNVSRDGELIWRHRGKHRLFVAKLASVDAVSVHVLTRHRRWQRYRDAVAERPDLGTDHPDLEDLVSK